jgi:hypothetical protein
MSFSCFNKNFKGYLNYRFKYDFVTNYDMDEYIFPRSMGRDFHESIAFDVNADCNETWRNVSAHIEQHKEPNFSLYRYVIKLIDNYGANIAHFELDHFLYLAHFSYLFEMIANNSVVVGKKEDDRQLIYSRKNTVLRFAIPRAKFKYFRHLKRLGNLIACLNETYLANNQTRLHFKWSNVFMMPFKSRAGKSIFNTNYTISINQHSGNLRTPNARVIGVDNKLGFVSHLRDGDPYFLNAKRFSISDLKVDVEFFYFLVKNRRIFL